MTVCRYGPTLSTHSLLMWTGHLENPHLQHLQLLQPLLYQLLDPARVLNRLVLMKCISRSPLRVFAIVVDCKLLPLPQQLAILWEETSRQQRSCSDTEEPRNVGSRVRNSQRRQTGICWAHWGAERCAASQALHGQGLGGLTSDRTCCGMSPFSLATADILCFERERERL